MTARIEIHNSAGNGAVRVRLLDTDGTEQVDYVNEGETRAVMAAGVYIPDEGIAVVDLCFADQRPEKVTHA